jgi:hypothetical protein
VWGNEDPYKDCGATDELLGGQELLPYKVVLNRKEENRGYMHYNNKQAINMPTLDSSSYYKYVAVKYSDFA